MADINDVLIAVNQGFSELHTKFDRKFDDFHKEFNAHQTTCIQRFTVIERDQDIRKALNGKKKEDDERKIDPWKYIIRGAATLGGGVAVTWIIMMIAQHWDVVIKALFR